MPAICNICSNECNSDSGEIKCCANCKQFYHWDCVKDSVEYKKTRSASKDWICNVCRNSASQGSSVNSTRTETSLTKEFLINVMEQFKKDMFDEMRNVNKELTEVKVSIEFLSNAVDTSNTTMKTIQTEMSTIMKENSELKKKCIALQSDVDGLKEKIRNYEQYSRRTNIEISGIPETPREDVSKIIEDLGAAIGVAVQDNHVTAAHRIPSFKRDRIPSLIVQFQTKVIRDTWIAKYKDNRNLTARNVNPAYPDNRVYINEHLSPDNKFMLSSLKKKCKEIGYKYVWCREGKFFVRRSEGERSQKINCLSDIDNLK